MSKHLFSRKFILKAISLVFSGLLIGRVLGFARETGLANLFGASSQSDALIVMLSIPTLLLSLLISGAMDATLIPEFQKRDKKSANRLFYSALGVSCIAFSGIALLGYCYTDVIVKAFAPGLQSNQQAWDIALYGTTICLLILPITAVTAVFQSRLYSVYSYWAPSLGTMIFNGVLVLVIFSRLSPGQVIVYLPWAAVLGALLRLVLHAFAWFLKSRKPLGSLVDELEAQSKTPVRKLLTHYGHTLATGMGLMLIPYIITACVSLTEAGEIAIFNYAIKLALLPSGIFLSVVATVIFPILTALLGKKSTAPEEKEKFNHLLNTSFLWLLQSGVLLSFGLIFISRELVSLAFHHGNMDQAAIDHLSKVVIVAFLSIPAQGFTSLTLRIFYAFQDALRPFIISMMVVLLMIVGSLVSVYYFNNLAVMWCYVFSQWFFLLGHVYFLKKKYHLSLFGKALNLRNIMSLAVASLVLYFAIKGIKIYVVSILWNVLGSTMIGTLVLFILLKITGEYKQNRQL